MLTAYLSRIGLMLSRGAWHFFSTVCDTSLNTSKWSCLVDSARFLIPNQSIDSPSFPARLVAAIASRRSISRTIVSASLENRLQRASYGHRATWM